MLPWLLLVFHLTLIFQLYFNYSTPFLIVLFWIKNNNYCYRCCVYCSAFCLFNNIILAHVWNDISETTVCTCAYFNRERGYSVSERFVWFLNLNGQLQISGQSEVQWVSSQSNNRHDQPRTDSILRDKYGHINTYTNTASDGVGFELKWRN